MELDGPEPLVRGPWLSRHVNENGSVDGTCPVSRMKSTRRGVEEEVRVLHALGHPAGRQRGNHSANARNSSVAITVIDKANIGSKVMSASGMAMPSRRREAAKADPDRNDGFSSVSAAKR